MPTEVLNARVNIWRPIADVQPSSWDDFARQSASELIEPIASFTPKRHTCRAASIPTVQQMISHLRADGMPVSAIAEAVKVERKTIYSWLNGGTTRGAHTKRVSQVYRLLTEGLGTSVRAVYRFWNTPISQDGTLREMICAEILNEAALRAALIRLGPQMRRAAEAEGKMSRWGLGNPMIEGLPETGTYR